MSVATIVFIAILLICQAYFNKHAPPWLFWTFWIIWTALFIALAIWVIFGDMHTCRFLCN
jgi:tellurite resistance protein TehA-like permease